jgi:hypothetical protein
MKIGVIGGCVGVFGTCFANATHHVACADVDEAKVCAATLRSRCAGTSPWGALRSPRRSPERLRMLWSCSWRDARYRGDGRADLSFV